MKKKQFTITNDHLKLLRRMYISWYDCEFGAPAVDCKRPYGNSYVYGDIAEILDIIPPDQDNGEDWSESTILQMDILHKQMALVLQIGIRVGYFRTGLYEAEEYTENWTRKLETA